MGYHVLGLISRPNRSLIFLALSSKIWARRTLTASGYSGASTVLEGWGGGVGWLFKLSADYSRMNEVAQDAGQTSYTMCARDIGSTYLLTTGVVSGAVVMVALCGTAAGLVLVPLPSGFLLKTVLALVSNLLNLFSLLSSLGDVGPPCPWPLILPIVLWSRRGCRYKILHVVRPLD